MSRRFGRRSTAARSVAASGTSSSRSEVELEVTDENEMDFPIEELREFLSADFFEVPADPNFKQGLRDKLWQMLQSRTAGDGPARDD